MASIRRTRTASGATAVQVVRYVNRRVRVLKHIGSARTEEELIALEEKGRLWYRLSCEQDTLFTPASGRLIVEGTTFLGAWRTLAHDTLKAVAQRCGLDALGDPLLVDLAIMRLVEPASKLRSLALIETHFGIQYAPRTLYRALTSMVQHKQAVERIAVRYATDRLKDQLALVLYDVTTLYFESFKADELRVPGFSKDNMAQQPQIMVGLLVTREGFPLGYEVFPGNTFEGKTMLPMLDEFVAAHHVAMPTVVADAAMLSHKLLDEITARGLSYIVGARLGTSPLKLTAKISTALGQRNGAMIRVPSKHGDMVCSFSDKRYRKDKRTLDAQVAKAKSLVNKGEPGKRSKFVKQASGKDGYVFNEELFNKATSLLGIKGYCTNIARKELSDAEVIARYHDLWQVEKAFRMAKNDLAVRPIYHRTQMAVRSHILICFVAVIMGRSIELATGKPLRRVIDELWAISDARLFHEHSRTEDRLRSPVPPSTTELVLKLAMSY